MTNFMKKLKKSVFIVAEISSNHAQDFNKAVSLVKKAKDVGADAVKFQIFTADSMAFDIDSKYFSIKHPRWQNRSLYELYNMTCTPWSWFKRLKKLSDSLGIIFFASAFDKRGIDFLEKINVPVHKIASCELVDLPLIEYTAKTKKPLIMSTGMATKREIREAVNTARQKGARDIVLLKCVSDYPARHEDMNLATITDMKKTFDCEVGLSDHSMGISASIAAVSLGARVIEKHLTLSRKSGAADSFFSVEPQELKYLINNLRNVEKALGKVFYGLTPGERKSKVFKRRRSLFTVKNIKKGEIFIEENVKSLRSSFGLKPRYLNEILGKKAKRNLRKGIPLCWDMVQK